MKYRYDSKVSGRVSTSQHLRQPCPQGLLLDDIQNGGSLGEDSEQR